MTDRTRELRPCPDGDVYEASLPLDARRRHGVFYTPDDVASRLAAIALADHPGAPRVCDPCVGAGAFLLAAADLLAARGLDRRFVVEALLHGTDRDPEAVAITRAALLAWVGPGADPSAVEANVVVGDTLAAGAPPRPFDVVVGNPPFLGQLTRDTTRTPADRKRLAARFGPALGYADTAGLFLLAALDLAAVGGTVLLIQPESLLAARDGAAVRRAVLASAALTGLWIAAEPVFAAAVRVCAPVLRRGAGPAPGVRRWTGRRVAPVPFTDRAPAVDAATWAPLAAGVLGVPTITVARGTARTGSVGDMAEASSGFRQHFYGLAGCVVEDPSPHSGPAPAPGAMPLITAGLIDPGVIHWGRRPARFAGQRYQRPCLPDGAPLDADVAAWLAGQRRPKVVVATQTRVVEAAVDVDGTWIASVPTIAVACDPDDLWRVAAALLAPPVTAWALERFGGTALATGAIKLSARQVEQAPLPAHRGPWDEAAAVLADRVAAASGDSGEEAWRTALIEAGRLLTLAHGLAEDDPVLAWWQARLPRWRGVP